MVTSVAHVWFNAYFEGGDRFDSGVFETDWEGMDGIKGSTKKGVKALDRLKVVWRFVDRVPERFPEGSTAAAAAGDVHAGYEDRKAGAKLTGEEEGEGTEFQRVLTVPEPGEPVPESQAADWRGSGGGKKKHEKHEKHARKSIDGQCHADHQDQGDDGDGAVAAEKLKHHHDRHQQQQKQQEAPREGAAQHEETNDKENVLPIRSLASSPGSHGDDRDNGHDDRSAVSPGERKD